MNTSRARESSPRITAAQVIAGGIVVASIGWSVWLLRERPLADEVELLPDLVLSYAALAPVEAALDRAQLTDHRTEEGRIWVPRARQSAYMRALVEAEALPQKLGTSQQRALKETSPFQSRATLEETLRVARQEELRHAICSMPGIEDAVVLYDVADAAGLGTGPAAGKMRTASVHVRTKPDADLQPMQAQTIRVAVAASIAGLAADRVAVIDLRSGLHYTGPLEPAADAGPTVTDPELARRIDHERHITEKLRTALSFVKGAVVTVTVTLPAATAGAAAVDPAPRAPEPEPQPAAGANLPADLGRRETAVEPAPVPPVRPAAVTGGAESIVVSIAVPEAYLRSGILAAQAREPGLTEAAAEHREFERIRGHVMPLLPPTPLPAGRQVLVTGYPSSGLRAARRESARPPAVAPATGAAAKAGTAKRTPGELLDAAWIALAGGRPGEVPREVWLVAIGVASTLLAWLVLRAGGRPARSDDRPRRRPSRLDWSRLDAESPADEATSPSTTPRKAAA